MEIILGLIINLVVLTILLGPIAWTARNIYLAGSRSFLPGNWLNLFWDVALLMSVVLAVYWWNPKDGNSTFKSAFAMLAYAFIVWREGILGSMFKALKERFEVKRGPGEEVRRGSRLVSVSAPEGEREEDDETVTIGRVAIPRSLEAQHFLISGTTGSGKTQVINKMLRSVRLRGERAVIADPAGGFYARFGQAQDDLLNPFDQRSVKWSPFAEIRAEYDCERIAKAIIPDGSGDGGDWQHYAQTLMAQVMLSMHRNGERSIKKLLYWLTTADQKELSGMLAGSPAATLCAKGNDRMLASTRGIISTFIGPFQYLADEGDFSIREWIQKDQGDGWLFITYRDDQMGLLRNLVATFLELALVEGLSLTESQDRGLWYVMDEVDSLGKITSLRAGLTKLRKYGGRCILGLQTVSQLRTVYGRDEAQTLIANTSVKCILRAGDAETAKSMEHELGEQEIERSQINDTQSNSDQGVSYGQSVSTQVVRQSVVLASEIMGLPDLTGYLKLPGNEIGVIAIEYVLMADRNPAFM